MPVAESHFSTVPAPVVGRLAPSPTGALHVGNVRTFLFAWLAARSRKGRIILRIEDLEKPASGLVLEEMVSDLQWLGFDWDEGPLWSSANEAALEMLRNTKPQPSRPYPEHISFVGTQGPYIQSLRTEFYQTVFDKLLEQDKIYPCVCSRSDYAAQAPHEGELEPRYPGTCRDRFASMEEARLWMQQQGSRLQEPCWRFHVPLEDIEFEDVVFGAQRFNVQNTVGDFVVFKTPIQPSYQMAVVADDMAMGITQIIRGADLIPSTARQLIVYRALAATNIFGKEPIALPEWGHIPLMLGPDGKRIAKRHGDSRIRSLRDQGISASHIMGTLALWGGIDVKGSAMPRDLLLKFKSIPKIRDAFILDKNHLAELENS